ncbi:MAG: redoxin domain-containing protein [Saprospiraceae bacterium]
MRKIYLSLLQILLLPALLPAQEFTVYDDFAQLEERIERAGENTVLLVNFWATWCAPCVDELPCFDEMHQDLAGEDFQVILVSLDFKSRIEPTLIPFLKRWKLIPEVVVLADQNADSWIPKVHPDWNGTIPATVMICGKDRDLHPEKFDSYQDLEEFVFTFLRKVNKEPKVRRIGSR